MPNAATNLNRFDPTFPIRRRPWISPPTPLAHDSEPEVGSTRIDSGPGYRVYYGRDGDAVVILLAGGTKKRQNRDIADAKDGWKDYKDRKRRGG